MQHPIIDKILEEWSYRVNDGMPNPSNPLHLIHLEESIDELHLPREFKIKFLEKVRKYVDNAKNRELNRVGDTYGSDKDEPKKKTAGDDEETDKKVTKEVPKQVKKIFDGSQNSVRDGLLYMSDEDKQLFDDFKGDFLKLQSNPSPELAQQMVEKYGLEASSGAKPKVYMRNINFEARKILGQNNATVFIKDTLETSLGKPLKGGTKGVNVKQEVITTSKPELKTKKTSKDDKGVKEFFDRPPYDQLDGNFHQMFGPTGDDGNLLMPSNKHSKEYLRQSITENKALDTTINKLEQLEKEENVSPKIRESLSKHRDNLKNIYENYDIPSKEASQAIGDSYATMAETINVESPTLAGAMMKNMAEMALYDTELANGEEVYLPSHGSFPGGDKLKVTREGNKVERVASVSVKYGRSGKYGSFGFPGETGQYQKYHPDPEYRDRLHSRPGDDGYNLGVKDDIIKSDEQMDKIVDESGMGDAIKDRKKLYSIYRNQLDEIQKLKDSVGFVQNPKGDAAKLKKQYFDTKTKTWNPSEMGDKYNKLRSTPPAWKQLNIQKEKIEEIEKKAMAELQSVIDKDKLTEMIGADNVKTAMNHPEVILCALTFSSTLKTSNGLDVIEHNHQEIKDGKYESHTDTAKDGTDNIRNWKFTWRAWDSRAGGLICSFNSDRREM